MVEARIAIQARSLEQAVNCAADIHACPTPCLVWTQWARILRRYFTRDYDNDWLVVWNIFFPYIGKNIPN